MLAHRSAAGDQDNRRAIDWCTALNVEAAAKILGDHAAFDEPALVGTTVALKHDDGASIGSGAILYVNAFTLRPHELGADDGEGIGNGNVGSCGAASQYRSRKAKHQ